MTSALEGEAIDVVVKMAAPNDKPFDRAPLRSRAAQMLEGASLSPLEDLRTIVDCRAVDAGLFDGEKASLVASCRSSIEAGIDILIVDFSLPPSSRNDSKICSAVYFLVSQLIGGSSRKMMVTDSQIRCNQSVEMNRSLNTQTQFNEIGGILSINEKPSDVVLKYVSSSLRDLY